MSVYPPEFSFRTSDLYFAAYLKVAGARLLGTERAEGRVVFLFEDQGAVAMKQLREQYFSDYAQVHALSFSQAIQEMKSLLFQ